MGGVQEATPAPISHQLVQAVKRLDLAALKHILDHHDTNGLDGLDLNNLPGAALVYGQPPVFHSIGSIGGQLLHFVASMSMSNHASSTPALRQEVLGRLIDAGVDVESADQQGCTPLHWASALGDEGSLLRLLVAGASPNAIAAGGRTPLHKLCSAGTQRHGPKLGPDAVARLVQPLLDAGADPTVPSDEGLRPYDLTARWAGFGPAAVQAGRDGLIGPGNPPMSVAGAVVLSPLPASQPATEEGAASQCTRCGKGPSSAAADFCTCVGPASRWEPADLCTLEELARAVDGARRRYVQSAFSLLLWHSFPAGGAFGQLPEEVLHAILLRACPDAGLARLWHDTFAAVAEHAAVANVFARRGAALAAWRLEAAAAQRDGGMAAEATEARLEQLSEQYDHALNVQKQVRRRSDVVQPGSGKAQRAGERSRARAACAVDAFAKAAHRVLFVGLELDAVDGPVAVPASSL